MWRPLGGVGKRLTVLKKKATQVRTKTKRKGKWKYRGLERRKRRLKSKIEDHPHTHLLSQANGSDNCLDLASAVNRDILRLHLLTYIHKYTFICWSNNNWH
jgi:hypothetical protein